MLTWSQCLATRHTSCCCLIPLLQREGHTYLQAKVVLWEQSVEGHLLPKSPQAQSGDLVTDTVLSCLFFFWHHLTPPTVQWCQSACFQMKKGSACYPKCQCMLTITPGGCSGEEVNDQQATAVTTVHMDASNWNCWFSQPWVNRSPQRGLAGWRDSGEEVLWCRTIAWGLTFWGRGEQEADAWVIQRQTCVWGVLSAVGVRCCNYYVVARCTSLCASHVHQHPLPPVYNFCFNLVYIRF